jgi:hypothetical protein
MSVAHLRTARAGPTSTIRPRTSPPPGRRCAGDGGDALCISTFKIVDIFSCVWFEGRPFKESSRGKTPPQVKGRGNLLIAFPLMKQVCHMLAASTCRHAVRCPSTSSVAGEHDGVTCPLMGDLQTDIHNKSLYEIAGVQNIEACLIDNVMRRYQSDKIIFGKSGDVGKIISCRSHAGLV